jgi:shikimate kinase
MEKRRPIYESLATFTVNTDNRKAQEIADSLVETIKA